VNNIEEDLYVENEKIFPDEVIEKIIQLQKADITGFVVCNLHRSYDSFTEHDALKTSILNYYYTTTRNIQEHTKYLNEFKYYLNDNDDNDDNNIKKVDKDDLVKFSPKIIYESIINKYNNFYQTKIPVDVFRQGLFKIKIIKTDSQYIDYMEHRYFETIVLFSKQDENKYEVVLK
jgi:hypothetical protein